MESPEEYTAAAMARIEATEADYEAAVRPILDRVRAWGEEGAARYEAEKAELEQIRAEALAQQERNFADQERFRRGEASPEEIAEVWAQMDAWQRDWEQRHGAG